jgi:hypothetical protein
MQSDTAKDNTPSDPEKLSNGSFWQFFRPTIFLDRREYIIVVKSIWNTITAACQAATAKPRLQHILTDRFAAAECIWKNGASIK